MTCRDVVSDTVHQFAPAYHDYVLYSDGGTKPVPPKTGARGPFLVWVALKPTCIGGCILRMGCRLLVSKVLCGLRSNDLV